MKTVFKKNQVIITALAIMLAVAGYLNFTKEKAQLADETFMADNNETAEGGIFGEAADSYEYADISDEDMMAAEYENQNYILSDTGEMLTASDETDKENIEGITEAANGTENSVSDTGESAELTSAGEESGNTSGTGTEQPGEAVLASTILDSGFFSNAKLTREQNRAKNREMLMELATDETISEESRQSAIDSIIKMAETSELENAAEILLEAKGFEGAVVNIASGNVDVVIDAETVTDAQVAQIEDIVMRKTQIEAENIVITNVVTQD